MTAPVRASTRISVGNHAATARRSRSRCTADGSDEALDHDLEPHRPRAGDLARHCLLEARFDARRQHALDDRPFASGVSVAAIDLIVA